jgi:hypothetical protein
MYALETGAGDLHIFIEKNTLPKVVLMVVMAAVEVT